MTEKEAWDGLQREVALWGEQTFPTATLESILKHLKREVLEFEATRDPVELADCVMLIIHLAHRRGVSLQEEIRKKFEIVKLRKWGKPDHEGVVEHIREEG